MDKPDIYEENLFSDRVQQLNDKVNSQIADTFSNMLAGIDRQLLNEVVQKLLVDKRFYDMLVNIVKEIKFKDHDNIVEQFENEAGGD